MSAEHGYSQRPPISETIFQSMATDDPNIRNDAWEEFVGKTTPDALRILRRTTRGNPEQAEDNLQNTYLKFHRKITRDGLPPDPEAYFWASIHNAVTDEQRRETRSQRLTPLDPATDYPDTTFVPFDELLIAREENTERRAQIHQVATQAQNEVFQLHRQGYTPEETADKLGIRYPLVRQRLFRLREKVQSGKSSIKSIKMLFSIS